MTRQEIYEELGKLWGDWKGAIRSEYKKSWTNCSNEELERFALDWKTRPVKKPTLTPIYRSRGTVLVKPLITEEEILRLTEEGDIEAHGGAGQEQVP